MKCGQTIGDKYRLVREIGRGGMAVVWEAEHVTLRSRVAVKRIFVDGAQAELLTRRFLHEARNAAQVHHRNIVDILDFGREKNQPYMVMEYLRGRSLSQVIAMDGKLDIKRAATIAIHTMPHRG